MRSYFTVKRGGAFRSRLGARTRSECAEESAQGTGSGDREQTAARHARRVQP